MDVSPQQAVPGPRAMVLVPIVLFAALTLAYSASIANQLTGDAVWYAHDIIHPGDQFFHPHHLMYNPLMRGMLLLAGPRLDGGEPKVIYLQWINLLITSLAMTAFCVLMMRLGVGAAHAGLFGLVLGLCGSYYALSSQIEVYSVTTLCLCVTLLGMTLTDEGRRGRLLTASGFTASMLFHQTAIFLAPAILLFELMHHRGERGPLLRRLVLTLVLPVGVVAAVYLLVAFSLGHRDPLSFWRWLTTHAQMGLWGKGAVSYGTLRTAAANMLNSLLVKGPGMGRWRLFFLGSLNLAAVAWIAGARRSPFRRTAVAPAALIWAVCLAGFSIWWDAQGAEYWGMVFMGVCLILAMMGGRAPERERPVVLWRAAGTLCIALTLIPLSASAVEHHRRNLTQVDMREAARTLLRVAREGDTVWAANTGLSSLYRIYLDGRAATVLAIDVKPAREAAKRGASTGFTSAVIDYLGDQVRTVEAHGGRCLMDRWTLEGKISRTRLMKDLDLEEFLRELGIRFQIEPLDEGPEPYFHRLRPGRSDSTAVP